MTIELGKEIYFPHVMVHLDSGDLCICSHRVINIYDYKTGVKIKSIALPLCYLDSATLLHDNRLCISARTTSLESYRLLILNLESEEYEQEIKLEKPLPHITQLRDGRLISSRENLLTEWK
jgi:hypothetical protein